MSKVKYKLTIGIKSEKTTPPTFMDDEAPGVFALKEFEVPVGESEVSMAMWAIDQEDEMVKQCVEMKWTQCTE